MAFLQWRRFLFFDKDQVKQEGSASPLDSLCDLNISVCSCGKGHLVFGDLDGNVHTLNRNLQLQSFKAYELRVTHLYQLKQHNLIVSVGEDEPGVNPVVKVWNLDKKDKSGNPLCCRIFRAIPGNKPTEVTCLALHESLYFMAIGFTDGSVMSMKGDITKDRHCKTQVLENSSPITGLAFRQVGKAMYLFVVTTDDVQSLNVSTKDCARVQLDQHGCAVRCSALSDLSQDNQFVIARNDCVYLYQPDERGPCFAFEGEKKIVHWYRGFLVVVTKDSKGVSRVNAAGLDKDSVDMNILTIYDLENKLIAYSAPFPDVLDVLAEWGSLYVVTGDRKLMVLQERDTQTKLEMLFKKNLYVLAINLAKTQHLDSDDLADIFRQYGDHLYNKGDHDGAIQQYIRTIGKLEPSYVIRKFLDAQRIHNLTAYLQALHRQSLANEDHTTLLLNCYTKLKDGSKLDEFIKTREVIFDVETAIKVLRQAGYFDHALFLAERDQQHEWYLKIQLEDKKDYQRALKYISKLPFAQAESNMKRYGKCLMQHVPEETTNLLRRLCTDYKAASAANMHEEGLVDDVNKGNAEEFIHIFANNRAHLKEFLKHMTEVEPVCPMGVYETLLELELRDWVREDDPRLKLELQNRLMKLLRSGVFSNDIDKALIMCQMHNFKDGVLFLYEKAHLYQQVVQYHMDNDDYAHVIESCKKFGDKESGLWEQVLGYFASKEENCKQYIMEVLEHIDSNNLMLPLLVVQTLARNSTATLASVKDYVIRRLQQEQQEIADNERMISLFEMETEGIQHQVQELKSSAKIFQMTKCSVCKHPLELPSVNFLCGHAYHQHCFETYAENDSECPACLPENRKILDLLKAQEQTHNLYEQFYNKLEHSKDGFSVVADYFGRGVFNKITLVTDITPTRKQTAGMDPIIQRELLFMPQGGNP